MKILRTQIKQLKKHVKFHFFFYFFINLAPRRVLIPRQVGIASCIPVRAVWNDESSKWWFCAVDIAEALTGSKSPRKYWNTIKSRNPQLSSICGQLKLMVSQYQPKSNTF
jgi:hypothetical protein